MPTTSGTFTFAPSLAELVLTSYSRCGIRRTALIQEHFADARMEANLLLVEWANKGINLWAIDQQTLALTQGTAQYNLDSSTILVLDGFIRTTDSTGTDTDRLIFPISRTDYASFTNKKQQAPPTVFWYDRLTTPTITFWQVPDAAGPYTFVYYRMRQIQDASLTGGQNVEVPYRFLDAFGWGLSKRLALTYAPEKVSALTIEAKESWDLAAGADVEDVPLYVTPTLWGYYR